VQHAVRQRSRLSVTGGTSSWIMRPITELADHSRGGMVNNRAVPKVRRFEAEAVISLAL